MKCLRCGHTEKLAPLYEWYNGWFQKTDFSVCSNHKKCRARQQASRPARMKVNESDTPMPGNMMEMEWA